jgi:hypothetical protein
MNAIVLRTLLTHRGDLLKTSSPLACTSRLSSSDVGNDERVEYSLSGCGGL